MLPQGGRGRLFLVLGDRLLPLLPDSSSSLREPLHLSSDPPDSTDTPKEEDEDSEDEAVADGLTMARWWATEDGCIRSSLAAPDAEALSRWRRSCTNWSLVALPMA